jgi:hypothetical protein
MFSKTMRLETIIVAVAVLVLLLCSQPPRSGNADVYLDVEAAPDPISAPAEPLIVEEPPALPTESDAAGQAAPVEEDDSVNEDDFGDDLPDDVSASEPISTGGTSPQGKRMAMVDARNSKNFHCDKVMYGEVTVRLIWDGTKLVPQKVCVVEGEDGVDTVWSFDQPPEGVIISEIDDTSGQVQ